MASIGAARRAMTKGEAYYLYSGDAVSFVLAVRDQQVYLLAVDGMRLSGPDCT